jgi:serine phosphatase RsbU (regulator of sigma subunit)
MITAALEKLRVSELNWRIAFYGCVRYATYFSNSNPLNRPLFTAMKSARLLFMTPAIWLGWQISFAWKYWVTGIVVLFAAVYLSIPLFKIHQENVKRSESQQEGVENLVRTYGLLNQVLQIKIQIVNSGNNEFQGDEVAQNIDLLMRSLHSREETLIASRLWREWSFTKYQLALDKEQIDPAICDKSIALLVALMQENARHHHRKLSEDLDIAFDFLSDDLPAVMRNLASQNTAVRRNAAPDLKQLNRDQQGLNESIPQIRLAMSRLQDINAMAWDKSTTRWSRIFWPSPAASATQITGVLNVEPLIIGLMVQQDLLDQLQDARATAAEGIEVTEQLRSATLGNLKLAQGMMEQGIGLIQEESLSRTKSFRDGYRELVWTLSIAAFWIAYTNYGFYLGTLKSVIALSRGTNAFCAGQRDVRIKLKSQDELRLLASNFNTMAQETERLVQTIEEQNQTRERDLKTLVDALGNKNEELYAVNHRVHEELNLARSVQLAILPQVFPSDPTWSVHACMHPARELGGDFYDCFPLPDGRHGILVADVSGKGVGAAFFMAVSRTVLLDSALTVRTPAQVLALANDLLCARNPMDLFVTACYALYDPRDGTLVYASAGHHAPLIRREGGTVETLTTSMDMALGVLPDMQYSEHIACLSRGDALLMFTDGVTEAFSHQDVAYGEERLIQWLSESPTQGDAKVIVDSLIQDVALFVAGAEASDDLTCLVLCRKNAEYQNLDPAI